MIERPSTAEIRASIGALHAVCEDGPSPGDAGALAAAIARLLDLGAHMTHEEPGEDAPEPGIDRTAAHRRGVARFPDLEVVHEDEDGRRVFPLDDLGDTYADMCQVAALFETGDAQNARWKFRFGFESHWGAHASALLNYLLSTGRA